MVALPQLAAIRRALNLSQTELGSRAGFTQNYISLLERGLRPISETHVMRIAAVLGVEPSALRAEVLTIATSPSGVVAVNHR